MENAGNIVPKQITNDEVCIRCVFQPFHIDSNGKLKREALLPSPNLNSISLLRLSYMPLENCIEHGHKISKEGKVFTALASLTRGKVLANNKWAQESKNYIEANIIYAPMNGNEYVDKNIDVFVDDKNVDLPAHADLKYNVCLDSTVRTKLRQYASNLVKQMDIIYKN